MADDPLEEVERFLGVDVIDEHALALGRLCIYWATLENVLFSLLADYLNSKPTALAVRAPDVSTLCEQIRKLAHSTGPTGEWRDCLIRILNMIQGELAETRNRYIHDDWEVSEAGMTRIDRRPKLQKPQSRQAIQLISDAKTVIPVEWVDMLTDRVVQTMVALSFMGISVRMWRGGRSAGPPQKAIEVSNYKPLAEMRPPAPTRWKRPPRSSRE